MDPDEYKYTTYLCAKCQEEGVTFEDLEMEYEYEDEEEDDNDDEEI